MMEQLFENIEILDAGAEGKAIARIGDLVIFVPFVVPGDIVDIQADQEEKIVTWKARPYGFISILRNVRRHSVNISGPAGGAGGRT